MNPMQTAAPIAKIRAAEAELPPSERLFSDPYAALFADADEEVVRLFASVPFFVDHVRLRTRHIDDTVRRALAEGCRDVVLVGAGFDCRGLRMPEIAAAGARVVELDHVAQLDEKRRRLTSAGIAIPRHVVHQPADLSMPGELERAVDAAGVADGARVLWVCEGLLGYLAKDDIRALAERTARKSGVGSTLIANHAVSAWPPEAVLDAFAMSGWRARRGPRFDALYRTFFGGEPPPESHGFGFIEAVI